MNLRTVACLTVVFAGSAAGANPRASVQRERSGTGRQGTVLRNARADDRVSWTTHDRRAAERRCFGAGLEPIGRVGADESADWAPPMPMRGRWLVRFVPTSALVRYRRTARSRADNQWWSVSYEVFAPQSANVDAKPTTAAFTLRTFAAKWDSRP